jgi:hypothetical protein
MEEKELAPSGAFCITQTTQEYLDSVIDLEIELSEKLNLLAPEDKLRFIKQEAATSFSNYYEVAKFSKDFRIEAAQNIKEANKLDPDYVPIERFTTEMGVDGMVHIIRDKGTVEDAYNVVAEKHNKGLNSLKEMSTKEHYNRHEIIESTEKLLPAEITKIADEGLYSMITSKTTINSMFDNTYTTMKILGELDSLRSRVSELEMRQTITEFRLDNLGAELSITDANKVAALKLKADGYNNTQIAKKLGVRRETVSRWINAV